MKGLLIYDRVGAERNAEFIKKLMAAAEAFGLKLEFRFYDTNISYDKDIDFAVIRTIAPDLSAEFEQSGVRVFNNAKTALVANDKWLTYLKCVELDIPTVPTYDKIPSEPFLPCVVKSRNGHGGTEVGLVSDAESLKSICNAYSAIGKTYIVQKLGVTGKDMRLYVLGGEVIAGVMRTSKTDFRSNYSLGGECALVTPTRAQIEIAKKLCDNLSCDYVGVDFIEYNGIWALNEIEDVVGARMLYKLTNTDIATEYMRYIKAAL